MIRSMTGYAALSRDLGHGTLSLEVRSVNSRYLDLHFRIVEDLRFVEPALRELISTRVGRGKVECRLGYAAAVSGQVRRDLNGEILERLAQFETQVRTRLPQAAPLSVADVLRWPGIFGDDRVDPAQLQQATVEMAGEALTEFAASRVREGARLAETITTRLARIREIVADVAPRIPAVQQAFEDKLRSRMLELIGNADDDRIRQEVVVYAARIDVAEELNRLTAHVDEVTRVLAKGGTVGKRLDFLMQELNREANTLGSKSVVQEVSAAAMELKLLIEQMREQIQNLE